MKILKRIIYTTIITTIMIVNFTCAVTNDDLKDINKKIQETSTEITDVKNRMSDALTQISQLNTNINLYEKDISSLETKINNLNNDILEKEKSIEEQENKYKNVKELLDKRLVLLYESGTTSYLDVLLSSDSFSDFISKYYLVSIIAEADEELLNSISGLKEKITKEKENLVYNKQEIEKSKNDIETKKVELSSSISKKKLLVSNLSAEEKELEEQLLEYEEDRNKISDELSKLVSKNNKEDVSSTPSKSGYICPLRGKTKANITTDYYEYYKHTGVDFAIGGGTEILCVKDGTVLISTALRNSNGAYRSYGEYVAIDHHDGTVTIYAHMKSGSRRVAPGENVKQGQVIGLVGMTGRATGNHLHFEVRINNGKKDVNPKPYLP